MQARKIIKELGGPTVVARKLRSEHKRGYLTTAAVSKWRRIPIARCSEIAELSGGKYTPQQLRPDFRWPEVA